MNGTLASASRTAERDASLSSAIVMASGGSGLLELHRAASGASASQLSEAWQSLVAKQLEPARERGDGALLSLLCLGANETLAPSALASLAVHTRVHGELRIPLGGPGPLLRMMVALMAGRARAPAQP